MLNIKSLLTKIVSNISTLTTKTNTLTTKSDATVDYIVEQGSSGIWTYRKWASGVAECWGYSDMASSAFTATGSVYYRTFNTAFSFPFTFKTRPYVWTSTWMGNVGGTAISALTTSTVNVTVLSAVSSARAPRVHIYAKGDI